MTQVAFSYKALDKDGKPAQGTVEAPSKEEALAKIKELRDQGLRDISVEDIKVDGVKVDEQDSPPQPITTPAPIKLTRNCPYCAEEIQVKALKCKHCGSALDGKTGAEEKISKHIRHGFVVQHRDQYRVQLMKKKRFSMFWAIFWAITSYMGFGIGVLFYCLYYWWKKDKVITVNL